MEKIIQKAIEGGYKYELPIRPTANPELLFLDPLFWQALSKVCKWKSLTEESYNDKNAYLEKATEFHYQNLTQGFDSAVAWLSDLVDKK